VEVVPDGSMGTYGREQDVQCRHTGQGKISCLRSCAVGCLAGDLNPCKGLQVQEIMMISQPLAGYDNCSPVLCPTLANVLGDGRRMSVLLRPEAGPGIEQERVLIGLEHQAPVATAGVDRRNHTAIAVERIGGHHLAIERDQAVCVDRGLQFRDPIGRHGGQWQMQPDRMVRDHTSRRALSPAWRAPRNALPSMAITSPSRTRVATLDRTRPKAVISAQEVAPQSTESKAMTSNSRDHVGCSLRRNQERLRRRAETYT